MSAVDFDWARKQLSRMPVSETTKISILGLLADWDKLDRIPDDEAMILSLFSALAKGHAIVEDDPEDVWAPAESGDIVLADIVRVRKDAFTGDAGHLHNGRIGRVVSIRYGDIIVRSIDGLEPELDGVHYPAAKLDRKIK